MNGRQREALKRIIEAGHPDAGTTVTPDGTGTAVVISGPKKTPGLDGPGGHGDVILSLGDNSPFLRFLLARHQLTSVKPRAARD